MGHSVSIQNKLKVQSDYFTSEFVDLHTTRNLEVSASLKCGNVQLG